MRVFDVYEGDELAGGKSIAVTVVLRPADKTLTEADIEAVAKKVVEKMERATGGHLRS